MAHTGVVAADLYGVRADSDDVRSMSLTILLVGTRAWLVEEAALALETAGHRVVRCQGTRDRLPCRALRGDSGCPLDAEPDVVLDVRARPLPGLEPDEVGAVCALRDGVPLIVAGHTIFHPFVEVADRVVGPRDDVVIAVEEVAAQLVADDE